MWRRITERVAALIKAPTSAKQPSPPPTNIIASAPTSNSNINNNTHSKGGTEIKNPDMSTLSDAVKAIWKKAEDEQNQREDLRRRTTAHRQNLTAQDVASLKAENAVEVEVKVGPWETPDGPIAGGQAEMDAAYGEYPLLHLHITGQVVLLIPDEQQQQTLRVPVASCDAYLVRPVMPFGFAAAVGAISPGCAQMARTLFDDTGALREQHCTSVWKSGFADGRDLLLVENLTVDACAQRQGLGTRLLSEVLSRAVSAAPETTHAMYVVTMPTFAAEDVNGQAQEQRARDEQMAVCTARLRGSVAFTRRLGFRRLGKSPYFARNAKDGRSLCMVSAAEPEDYDPEPLLSPLELSRGLARTC